MAMSYHDLPNAHAIVNVDKGYTLRRIGTFPSSLENHVIHSFISMDDLCMASSTSDMCMFVAGSTDSVLLQVATMLGKPLEYPQLSDMNRDTVSNFIGESLDQTLMKQHPDRYLNITHPVTHCLNAQFISSTNDDTDFSSSISSSDIDRSEKVKQNQHVSRFTQTKLAAILHQIDNQQLSFDYMNDEEQKYFLKNILLFIDQSFSISSIRQSLEIFHKFIIGQSIFLSRFCSSKKLSSSAKPCLIVSTMFVKPPSNDPNSFSIYQLTALPAIFQHLLESIKMTELSLRGKMHH